MPSLLPLIVRRPSLTCGGSESLSSCWCSSWLCSTDAAGSWTGETACCPPPEPAAGPGSGRGAVACRSWSWSTASGWAAGTGWGWRGCEAEVVTRSKATCPWIPACSLLPRAGGAVMSGRRAERWWSGACWCSSCTHPVLSLDWQKKDSVELLLIDRFNKKDKLGLAHLRHD